MSETALFFLLVGLAGLILSAVGGVHMLPSGWVYRREEPEKFWFIFAAQAVGTLLFVGVVAFGTAR